MSSVPHRGSLQSTLVGRLRIFQDLVVAGSVCRSTATWAGIIAANWVGWVYPARSARSLPVVHSSSSRQQRYPSFVISFRNEDHSLKKAAGVSHTVSA